MTGSARYLAHEAGHLAGVPGDRVGQWARWGHIQASVSAEDPHVYAFDDVAEAIAVHELLGCGLRLSVIRRAVAELGGPAGWPLSRAGLHVVHGRLAVARGDELVELLGMGAQEILPFDGRLDPVATLRAGGWPARVLGLRSVEVDPDRLGGRAVLRGRRIALQDAVTLDDPAEHEIDAATMQEARAWLRHG